MEVDDRHNLPVRTKRFALRVIKLVNAMPKSLAGRTIGSQLVRCGTSVAANYRASCKARSKAEFIAKIGVVEEEADESCFWMEMIIEPELIPAARVAELLSEAREITKIMASSRLTAKRRS